jgi:hypothetical protein
LQAHAHVVGLDGQLASAAVDQHGQLDRARPTIVGQHVHGGAYRAAGEQDVVDQHHGAAFDALRQLGGPDLGLGQAEKHIIAIERDVDGAQHGPTFATGGQHLDHALGQHRATGADADQVGRRAVALDDLEGDAAQDPGDSHSIENFPSFDQVLVRRCWAKLHVRFPYLGGGPGAALTVDNARPAANCQAWK